MESGYQLTSEGRNLSGPVGGELGALLDELSHRSSCSCSARASWRFEHEDEHALSGVIEQLPSGLPAYATSWDIRASVSASGIRFSSDRYCLP